MASTSNSAQLLGKSGEMAAARYYQESGHKIIARNWRTGHLELDLICEKCNEIIFVEVKTRKNDAYGGGYGAITANKKRHLIKAALLWLREANKWTAPCRFDVLCLYPLGSSFRMEQYRDAIELSTFMDSCHAYWQPW